MALWLLPAITYLGYKAGRLEISGDDLYLLALISIVGGAILAFDIQMTEHRKRLKEGN